MFFYPQSILEPTVERQSKLNLFQEVNSIFKPTKQGALNAKIYVDFTIRFLLCVTYRCINVNRESFFYVLIILFTI